MTKKCQEGLKRLWEKPEEKVKMKGTEATSNKK